MRRQSLLILKYSVFLAMICVQGCALLMVRGIEFMKERNDIKERVDVSYSTEIKIEEVWYAALKASNNLGLSIVTKDFGGNNGLIVASTSSRNYIHIYIVSRRFTHD